VPIRIVAEPIAEITLPSGLVLKLPLTTEPALLTRFLTAVIDVVLTLGLTGRIWLAVEPIEARKSFEALAAVVTQTLGRDPLAEQ